MVSGCVVQANGTTTAETRGFSVPLPPVRFWSAPLDSARLGAAPPEPRRSRVAIGRSRQSLDDDAAPEREAAAVADPRRPVSRREGAPVEHADANDRGRRDKRVADPSRAGKSGGQADHAIAAAVADRLLRCPGRSDREGAGVAVPGADEGREAGASASAGARQQQCRCDRSRARHR